MKYEKNQKPVFLLVLSVVLLCSCSSVRKLDNWLVEHRDVIVDDGPAEKTVREMEFFVEGDTKEHLTKLAEEYPVVAKSNYVSATIDGAPQVAESGSKMYIPYKNAGKYVDYLLRKEFERDKLNCRSTHCSVVIGIEEQNGGSLIYVRATVMHNIGSFTEYVRGDLQERLDF